MRGCCAAPIDGLCDGFVHQLETHATHTIESANARYAFQCVYLTMYFAPLPLHIRDSVAFSFSLHSNRYARGGVIVVLPLLFSLGSSLIAFIKDSSI